jgi:glycosyltransferase involved in cell wall biosynthesis
MLSIAMMVKNEAKNLDRCLKSVETICTGNLVIVDTGSIDNTVEIAQKYTKNVYHQKWANDFSLHRNYSFSKCTGEWIMQIDADEELHFEHEIFAADVLAWLHKLPPTVNAVGIKLKDWRESKSTYAAELDVIRIFRNKKVKFHRRVHNEPVYDGMPVYCTGLYLKHYGYDLTAEQKEQKAKRTISLLEKSIEENPEDYQSYFYLAQATEAWRGDTDKAIDYATTYVEHKDDLTDEKDGFNPSIYYFLATRYFMRDDMENCKIWLDMGLNHDRDSLDIDLSYILMLYGAKVGRGDIMAKGATAYILAYENFDKIRMQHVGKFYFKYEMSAYIEALFHLIMYHAANGSIGIKKIEQHFNKITPETRQSIKKTIKDELAKVGLQQINEKELKENERRIITPSEFQASANNINKVL